MSMNDMFSVMCNYECWTTNGKEFCGWHFVMSGPLSKEEADKEIKNFKAMTKDMDRKTKLKHEYKAVDYSEYETWLNNVRNSAKKNSIKDKKYLESIKEDRKKWAKRWNHDKKENAKLSVEERIARKAEALGNV